MSAGDEQSAAARAEIEGAAVAMTGAAAPDGAGAGGGAGEPQRKKAKKAPKAVSWRGHDGWSYRRGTELVEWVYIAPDGTEFQDEAAALSYEHSSGMSAGDDSGSVELEAARGHASTTVRPQRERAPPKQFLAGPASGKVADPEAEPPAPTQAVPKKDERARPSAGARRASGTKRRRSSSLGGGKKYTARDNEQPKEIAARLGVPVSELLKLNVGALPALFATSKLMEGTVLRLPARASPLAGSRRGWVLCSEDDQWYEGDVVVAAEGAGGGSFSVAYDETPDFHASISRGVHIEHNVARERVVCDGDRLFVSWDGELCNVGLDWRARVSLI